MNEMEQKVLKTLSHQYKTQAAAATEIINLQSILNLPKGLPSTKSEMLHDAPIAGIMYDKSLDPDIRSLRQTILYGLKGISAYGHQARELGYCSDQVDSFYITALESLTDDRLTVEELIRTYVSRTGSRGEMGILTSINQRLWNNYLLLKNYLQENTH